MKTYYFYSRNDKKHESQGKIQADCRYNAARYFAASKNLNLKSFLEIYAISK